LALKALVLSPLCGMLGGFSLMVLLLWITRRHRPAAVNRTFRVLQLASAGFMAFAHGSNDAQKSMGIITLALGAYAAEHAGGAALGGGPEHGGGVGADDPGFRRRVGRDVLADAAAGGAVSEPHPPAPSPSSLR